MEQVFSPTRAAQNISSSYPQLLPTIFSIVILLIVRLLEPFGGAAILSLTVFPIMYIGYLHGRRPGTLFGLFYVFIAILVLPVQDWQFARLLDPVVARSLAFGLTFGYLGGLIGDTRRKLHQELEERKSIEQQLRTNQRNSERIIDFSQRVAEQTLDEHGVLQLFSDYVQKWLGETSLIITFHDEFQQSRISHFAADDEAVYKLLRPHLEGATIPMRPEEPFYAMVLQGEPILVEELDLEQFVAEPEHQAMFRAAGAKSLLFVPVRTHSQTMGLLICVRTAKRECYTNGDLRLAKMMADLSALAMKNAGLYRDLQQAEEHNRYQAYVIANSHDAVISSDPYFVITGWNPAAERIYGFSAEEAIGKHAGKLLKTEDRERLVALFETDRYLQTEIVQYHKDGHPLHLLASLSQVRDEQGIQVGIAVMTRDITEQKQIERAMRQTEKLKGIGLLAGGIAHDFNNLLTSVLAQTSLAQYKLSVGSPIEHHLQRAIDSAKNAAHLTRQLLAYAGKGQYEIKPINLNELVNTNRGLFETARDGNNELRYDLHPKLPHVDADPGQIQQVLMNLVINALEASAQSTKPVTITTNSLYLTDSIATMLHKQTLGAEPKTGFYVRLIVEDSGSGISAEDLENVFAPYFSTKGTGRGLGLSATLGIIQSYDGFLQVDSALSQGSRFTVYLPAGSIDQNLLEGSVTYSDKVKDRVVLVVDDEEGVRKAVADILALLGIRVIEAANGQEGLAYYRQHKDEVSIVLLDMQMPGMSGEETFRALRQYDPDVNIIISSGYSESETMQHFLGQGLAAFLQKPYDINTLIDKVHTSLLSEPNLTTRSGSPL